MSFAPDSLMAWILPATLTVTSLTVCPSGKSLYFSMKPVSERSTWNLWGYGCVAGSFLSSSMAVERSLKYSLGEISSSLALPFPSAPSFSGWAGFAASFSAFSVAFLSAFIRLLSSFLDSLSSAIAIVEWMATDLNQNNHEITLARSLPIISSNYTGPRRN